MTRQVVTMLRGIRLVKTRLVKAGLRRAGRAGLRRLLTGLVTLRRRADGGMSTAEYAVGTIAAVAFAGVLFKVVSSPAVHAALTALVARALKAPF